MTEQTPASNVSLARTGALVGVATALVFALLQFSAASVAGVLWSVGRPALKLLLYPLCGAAAGAIVAVLVGSLTRRLGPSWQWTLTAAVLGLAGAVLRAVATAAVIKVPLAAVILVAALATVMIFLVSRRWLRRGCDSERQARRSSLVLMLPTLTLALYAQLVFMGDRFLLQELPWILRVAMIPLATIPGILLAELVLGDRTRPTALVRKAVALLVVLGVTGHGLWALKRDPSPAEASPPPGAPNVMVVVLDTLRRDAVSAYGVVDDTTPHLDRFADAGTLWMDAIVPGNWTIPGHASLFTGTVLSRHGAGHGSKALRLLPAGPGTPGLPTLAEIFLGRGWSTTAFVSNGQLSTLYGYDRGFSVYHELWRARKGDFDLLGRLLDEPLGFAANDRGGQLAERGLEAFFRSTADEERPWFLFVNLLEPHAPYDPPLPWTGRFSPGVTTRAEARRLSELTETHKYGGVSTANAEVLWQLYLNAVAYQDHLLGQILQNLERFGLDETTIVVVTSDHGENFGWRGQLSHGVDLNDDLIRIPLVARGPGIPVGVRDESPVSLIDVFPSLLFLTGADPSTDDPGRSGTVLPPLGPDEVPPDRARIAEKLAESQPGMGPAIDPEILAGRQAVLSGPWTLILEEGSGLTRLTRRESPPRPPGHDGSSEVTDADVKQRLEELLRSLRESWLHATDDPESEEVELDDETRRQLEALGYVG